MVDLEHDRYLASMVICHPDMQLMVHWLFLVMVVTERGQHIMNMLPVKLWRPAPGRGSSSGRSRVIHSIQRLADSTRSSGSARYSSSSCRVAHTPQHCSLLIHTYMANAVCECACKALQQQQATRRQAGIQEAKAPNYNPQAGQARWRGPQPAGTAAGPSRNLGATLAEGWQGRPPFWDRAAGSPVCQRTERSSSAAPGCRAAPQE